MSNYLNFIQGIIYDLDGTLNLSTEYYDVYDDYFTTLLSKFLNTSFEDAELLVNRSLQNKTGLTSLIQSLHIDSPLFYNELAKMIPINDLIPRDDRLIRVIESINNTGKLEENIEKKLITIIENFKKNK